MDVKPWFSHLIIGECTTRHTHTETDRCSIVWCLGEIRNIKAHIHFEPKKIDCVQNCHRMRNWIKREHNNTEQVLKQQQIPNDKRHQDHRTEQRVLGMWHATRCVWFYYQMYSMESHSMPYCRPHFLQLVYIVILQYWIFQSDASI